MLRLQGQLTWGLGFFSSLVNIPLITFDDSISDRGLEASKIRSTCKSEKLEAG